MHLLKRRLPPLKILGEVNTVIETIAKFLESNFYVAETKNINLLSDITSLALGLMKIDKREHMCFTNNNNKKNGNTQKEEMNTNETRTYPESLRNIMDKQKKRVFQNSIGKIKDYTITCRPERTINTVCFA